MEVSRVHTLEKKMLSIQVSLRLIKLPAPFFSLVTASLPKKCISQHDNEYYETNALTSCSTLAGYTSVTEKL